MYAIFSLKNVIHFPDCVLLILAGVVLR
jgi:hypothetical protein